MVKCKFCNSLKKFFQKIAKNSLFRRTVVSVLLIPLTIYAIYFGFPYINLFALLAGMLLAWEWVLMLKPAKPVVCALCYAAATSALVLSGSIIAGVLVFVASAVVLYVKTPKEKERKLLLVGLPYIALGATSVVWIFELFGFLTTVWFLLMVWCVDIGGYMVGKTLKGPKLAPKISPNKTWSGLVGGVCLSVIVSIAYAVTFQAETHLWFYGICAALIAVCAQIGDLVESAIKRHLKIKDSSDLIPGHGGIFDRVDGMIFTAPILVAVYAVWAFLLAPYSAQFVLWGQNLFFYVVPFLIILGILVFVHEFGHYLTAKAAGVKIDEFSIGFGKKLWGKKDRTGTEWCIRAIPLGGYVKMYGDEDATSAKVSKKIKALTAAEKKKTFEFQPPYKKLLIALSGPLSNYLLAVLVLAGIFMMAGKMIIPPMVGGVIPQSAAEEAGIVCGDVILKINGKDVKTFEELRQEVDMAVSGHVDLVLLRQGQTINKSFALKQVTPCGCGEPQMLIGINSVPLTEVQGTKMPLIAAVKEAGLETWRLTDLTLRGVGQIIMGKRSGEDVGGIIRIAEMSGDVSKTHNWRDIFFFLALLSINLGLINLFPIPALDGGHVVFSVVEMIVRKPINEKAKEVLLKIGVALLLALILFATWNDFVRLFNRWF